MLRMASVARVNRRLRRYYLIVRLLPNVFALAYRSLGSISTIRGHLMTVKLPSAGRTHVGLSRTLGRYLIVGVPAAMPLYSSFIFSLNNRACQQLAKLLCWMEKRSDRVGGGCGSSRLFGKDNAISDF